MHRYSYTYNDTNNKLIVRSRFKKAWKLLNVETEGMSKSLYEEVSTNIAYSLK